jgi:hypothetical protein
MYTNNCEFFFQQQKKHELNAFVCVICKKKKHLFKRVELLALFERVELLAVLLRCIQVRKLLTVFS